VATGVQEIGTSAGQAEVRLSLVTAVERSWLSELFPSDMARKRCVFFDPDQKRVVAQERDMFHDLLLGVGRTLEPTDEEAAAALGHEIVSGRLTLNTGIMRWSSGLRASTGWPSGVRSWGCRQSGRRIDRISLSRSALARAGQRKLRSGSVAGG